VEDGEATDHDHGRKKHVKIIPKKVTVKKMWVQVFWRRVFSCIPNWNLDVLTHAFLLLHWMELFTIMVSFIE
jgi:hypothetical protein